MKFEAMSRPLRSPGAASSRGASLIPLLIVMAVLGVLALYVYPQYRDQGTHEEVKRAVDGLAAVKARMDQHFQAHRTYASTATAASPCETEPATRTFGVFVVDCAVPPTEAAYLLRAQGGGELAEFYFTVNQANLRATPGAPPGWTTCATRWVIRKAEAC